MQVDRLASHPKSVRMEIKNESIGAVRSQNVKIHYHYMSKYYKECNLQGHEEIICRILHSELRPQRQE